MAFKVKKITFDWDVEVPLIEGGTEEVKCTKIMNGTNYALFVKHLQSVSPKTADEIKAKEMEITENAETGIELVIRQIDWLYEKGMEWWKENVAPDVIVAVQRHALDYAEEIGKKKV